MDTDDDLDDVLGEPLRRRISPAPPPFNPRQDFPHQRMNQYPAASPRLLLQQRLQGVTSTAAMPSTSANLATMRSTAPQRMPTVSAPLVFSGAVFSTIPSTQQANRNSLLSGGGLIRPIQAQRPKAMATGSKQYRNIQPKPPAINMYNPNQPPALIPITQVPTSFPWSGSSAGPVNLASPPKHHLPPSPQISPRGHSIPITEPPGLVPLGIPQVSHQRSPKHRDPVNYSEGGVQDLSRKSVDLKTVTSPQCHDEEPMNLTMKNGAAGGGECEVSAQTVNNNNIVTETVKNLEVPAPTEVHIPTEALCLSPTKKSSIDEKVSRAFMETVAASTTESGLLRSVSCNEENIPVEYDEAEFVWEDYLAETNSVAVPATAFKHIEASLRTSFEKGMRLEVPNKDEDDTYWVATVMMAAGQLLRLRFEGFQDNSTCDFWLDACASDLHPVGWCRSNEKKYSPPQVVKDKVEKWEDLLNELNESSSTHGATEKLSGTAPIDQIQTDTWLEVQNDHNPHTVWLAKVIQNVGGRLRLQHAGELATFWLFYLNCRLHPIGWAAELEYQLEPPPSVLKYLGSEEKCKEELTKAQSLADDNPFPSHIFEDLEQAAPHEFKEGWRLEAIHPVTHATLHPATVSKVIDDTYFMVQIDDLKETPSVQMCCHGNSPGLFPIHWSMYKGVKLVSPKGWSKSDFDWKEYLEAVKAEAAPESSFTNTFIPEHEFKRGMKLEVVDPIQPDAICAATITRVHDQLLWLHLDSANKMLSNYIVHVDSNDIFPIGWCDCNNYPLRPPKRSSYKKSSKKVAIVQPEKHMSADEYRSATYTQIKQAGEGNGWCPKIYFNHRCFSGAYLSKGRIAALPRCVGPGPVVLVMKEVLTMLINVAYKSSRVLRELQLEGEADPSMHLQILKAKYKGKSYCAKVEICKTRSQIEEFCRQICITLECCPNLFSTHHYEGNCPSNCWQLTKTKYSAYFGKKKKKRVGRPPGGHTNLENGPQKPGKRRRGRPPNRPSIFNTQETSTQENKEDAESVVSMETGSSCSLTEKPADVASIDREFVPKRKYKRRLPTAPMEMKTRGVKLPRYSHNMKQNKAPVESKPPTRNAKALPASSHDHDLLQLNSNPLYWTTEEVVEFLENTDCSDLTSIFQDQEIDGQAFMLLSLPTIQEYLELKLGPSIKLCHHIEQVKIAFYEQWA